MKIKTNPIIKVIFLVSLQAISVACSTSSEDLEGYAASNAPLRDDTDFAVLEKGRSSSYTGESTLVLSTYEQWKSHYNIHINSNSNLPLEPPSIDFDRESVIAIHLGTRAHTGYSVDVQSVTYDVTDSTTQIRYTESIDNSFDSNQNASVTHPYVFVRVMKSAYEFRFIKTATHQIN
jgi:hypothetical protein